MQYQDDQEQHSKLCPFITIVRCVDCHTHQWCTRHIEQDYRNKVDNLQRAIEEALPQNGFYLNVNQIHDEFAAIVTPYEFSSIYEIGVKIEKNKIPIGCMEVYFMDALLYSKRLNNVWPDPHRVAEKVRMAYELLQDGQSYYHLQHTKKPAKKKVTDENFTIARAKTPEMIQNELYPKRRRGRMSRVNRGTQSNMQSINTGSIAQMANESSAKNTNRFRENSNQRAKTPVQVNRKRLINDLSNKRNSAVRKGSNSNTRGTIHSKDSMTNVNEQAAGYDMNSITLQQQNVGGMTYNESNFEGQFMVNKQRPRTAFKQTQFKDRRLITLLNCKMIFQIIWEGAMTEYHNINLSEDQKNCYDREKVIHQPDLNAVVNFTAELLQKQDLCTREKPAKQEFLKMCTRKCPKCNQRVLSIKKMPQLLWNVFNTQADEERIEADVAFNKYYSSLLSDEVLINLVDILDFYSKQQYESVIFKVLSTHRQIIQEETNEKLAEIVLDDVVFIFELMQARQMILNDEKPVQKCNLDGGSNISREHGEEELQENPNPDLVQEEPQVVEEPPKEKYLAPETNEELLYIHQKLNCCVTTNYSCDEKQNLYNLSMYESKENLKYYAIQIKKDYVSYIGNKNIDCGNYSGLHHMLEAAFQRDLNQRKNHVNGAQVEQIFRDNNDELYGKNDTFNQALQLVRVGLDQIPLRSKIALEVFKHLADFFGSQTYSREFDLSELLQNLYDLTDAQGDDDRSRLGRALFQQNQDRRSFIQKTKENTSKPDLGDQSPKWYFSRKDEGHYRLFCDNDGTSQEDFDKHIQPIRDQMAETGFQVFNMFSKQTIQRQIRVDIKLEHKKMKFRHDEPIARVNYVKEVSFEQRSLVKGNQVGKEIKFHWDFPEQGNMHNQNHLQNISDLGSEHFLKYNEYRETFYIDGKPQDVVSFKQTNDQTAEEAPQPEFRDQKVQNFHLNMERLNQ